jgi:hypothetical protein
MKTKKAVIVLLSLPIMLCAFNFCSGSKPDAVIIEPDRTLDEPLPAAGDRTAAGQNYSKNKSEQEYVHKFGIIFKYDMETFRFYFDNKDTTPVEMIGWSKDGLFACRYKSFDATIFRRFTDLESPPDEYIVEHPARYSLVIIDAVTNEIIERDSIVIGEGFIGIVGENSTSYLYDEKEQPGLRGNTANLNEILEGYKIKWEELLRKHNIAGRAGDLLADNFQTGLSDFPINNYSCWFDYDKDNNSSDPFESESIIKWKLMTGNDAVQKIISEHDEKTGIWHIIGSKILGYYKNPYENSIVVVVSYYRYNDYSDFNNLWGTLNLVVCNMDDII